MSHRRSTIAGSLFLALATLPAVAQNQNWIRQLGTSADDFVYGSASDGAGGVYVGGETDGSLAAPHAGAEDAWVARYDARGTPLWVRQMGTSNVDYTCALAPDGSGGVFAAGRSYGSLGGPNAGAVDPWLARYDGSGNLVWLLQFGTSTFDYLDAVAPDGTGGVYLTGHTLGGLGGPNAGSFDAWFARYDGAGNQVWIRQLGSTGDDRAYVCAADPTGGFFTGGITTSSLGGAHAGDFDAWIARYDGAGKLTWIRQLGTSVDDRTYVAAIDGAGGVYFGGWSAGSLGGPNLGNYDAWLSRYDGAGAQQWIEQFGTSAEDNAYAAAPDASGGVIVGGWTLGSLGGPHAGGLDAWLARYDSSGNRAWSQQLGTSGDDVMHTASANGSGGVYVAGRTAGDLGGPSAGGLDAWLALYDSSCPAPTPYCIGAINSTGKGAAIGWSGTTSVGANDLVLEVQGCPPTKPGLFFFGVFQTQIPFGEGYLCVTGNQKRLPIVKTDASGAASFALDFTDPSSPASLIAAGSQWNFQFWYRDPQPVGHGFNFSNALVASFCP